ncbi:MAG: PKD domain-containing protein, partial [Bacteroidetes bacterium]|nr:PKD domain-containing protein [Bacteroidota bacterium]
PLGCGVPFVVNFTDSSTNAVNWFWDFGDGSTANVANPSHVYNTPGFYDITLVVENTFGCTDTIVQPSYVQIVRPTADFVADTVSGCIPLTVDFLNLSVSPNDPIANWIWDFGDGGTSFLQNPTHTYNAVGQFEVSLIVVTQSGCRDTMIYQFIEAGIKPTVDFAVSPAVACAGTPRAFTDLSNFATSWLWIFGDGGTSTQQNPIYVYSDTGTFDVTLIVGYYGCFDTLTYPDFTTSLGPVADFFMTPTTGCEVPITVNFFDQSIMPSSWFWDFGDGTTDTTQNPTHTYTAQGNYTITLVVTNDSTGCIDTYIQDFEVNAPAANFTAQNTSGCTGLPVTFNNSSTNATSYFWDFGDGNTSTASAPVHSYSSPGMFDVILIATNASGCSDTLTVPNLVSIVGPDAHFNAAITTGCAPIGNVSGFNDLTVVSAGSVEGWQWDFGDGGSSSGPNPIYTYNQPGNYDVTLTVVDNQGCADTLTIPNYIMPTYPAASFTSADTLACPGSLVS